jgi:signal transduction histidine kinase
MPEPLVLLAIDDNPADLELLRYHLEEIVDYEITLHPFTDPAAGTAWLREHSPDLVLLDYFLGAVSGLEVFAELRDAGVTLPVILLTGRGDEEVAVEAMRAGVTDYLPKSAVSPASLTRAFANALEKHRLREKVEAHRRQLEDTVRDLRRRNEEIQSFYHTLSHELKTPLTAAREFVCIVLDELAGALSPSQREYLRIVLASCDQMALYITDLLDASRLETGKLTLSKRPRALAPIVKRVLTALGSQAEERRIALESAIPTDLPPVLIDARRVVQVLTNLVNNALKFTPEGGRVRVEVRAEAQGDRPVAVSVSDTGRGIPPDQLDRIFDRLYQVHKMDHGSGGGLGLGLFLARELVKLHGGTIRVASRADEGSTFTFTLPRCVEPAPAAVPS